MSAHPLDDLIADMCRDEQEMVDKVALAFLEAFGDSDEAEAILLQSISESSADHRAFWEDVYAAFQRLHKGNGQVVPLTGRDTGV